MPQQCLFALPDDPYTLSLNIDDFRQHDVAGPLNNATKELTDGEVLFHVDKLALTANSISYGFAGKSGLIRYLDIYPAEDGFANLPCWGYADVVASKHPSLQVRDRVYGFLPIASHVVMQPGKVSPSGFTDIRPCRAVVPPFYNEYALTHSEP